MRIHLITSWVQGSGTRVALVWFFMFLLSGGGVAGVNMDPMAPVAAMIRHLLFAVPLSF